MVSERMWWQRVFVGVGALLIEKIYKCKTEKITQM